MTRSKLITFFCLLLTFSILISSCSQNDCRRVIFENDFKNGNNNTFVEYGKIEENSDSLTLYQIDGVGPLTYFGKNESKNSTFTSSGLYSEISMNIKLDDYLENEYFCWNFALNNNNDEILTNVKVYFKKVSTGLEINFVQNAQNSEVLYTISEDGEYVFEISFYSSVKDEILFNLTIKKDNKKIFSSQGNSLKIGEDSVKTDEVKGMRYAFLSEMTVEKIEVKKVRLLEN